MRMLPSEPLESDLPVSTTLVSHRQRLVAGLSWAAAYQVFELVVAFGGMLITVRLIPPGEYGRAAAVVGVLAALNTFSSGLFVSHALQLPQGQEPDWTMHWRAAVRIQGGLFVICELVALAAWTSPVYANVATLLHIAGIGILLAAPNQLGMTRLYRELDFARLKTISGVGMLLKLTCTIGFAVAGHGAVGIVLANNVLSCMPFAFDLLVIRRWRPRDSIWARLDWRAYDAPMRFGLQRFGAVVIAGVRDALEAAVLPVTLGFGAMGLLGRANGLYATTVGRVESIVIDTAYPFLPRASSDHARYAHRAMLLVQAAVFTLVPAACFMALEGPSLSRLLYGLKWVAADPLILPATVAGAMLTLLGLWSSILLGAGRVKRTLQVDGLAALLMLLALSAAIVQRDARWYLWATAVANGAAAAIAAVLASSMLPAAWLRRSLGPSAAGCVVGVFVWRAFHFWLPEAMFWHVVGAGVVFSAGVMLTFRLAFAHVLVALFDELHWPRWSRRILWLPVAPPTPAPAV